MRFGDINGEAAGIGQLFGCGHSSESVGKVPDLGIHHVGLADPAAVSVPARSGHSPGEPV